MQKANQKRTRAHNTRLVLNTIYSEGQISRAEIARKTNLTPPTISDVVSGLIDDGLVGEMGHAPSSSGRRAILLDIIDNSRQIIGIDLSRKDFRGAITDLRGKIDYRVNLDIEGRDGEKALLLAYDLIDDLVETAKSPILGIGIGAPGLIDSSDGVLQQAVNLNWRHIPLRNLFQDRYNLPVYLANDCQVAALAEYTFGTSVDNNLPLVVINMGWGVGAGIIIAGRLLHGSPIGAGEIGHVRVVENGLKCACGNFGCLETIASNEAIIKRMESIIFDTPQPSLEKSTPNPNKVDFQDVIAALENGNGEVQQIIYDAGEALGIAAANLVGVLGPCRILIHSRIASLNPLLIETIRDTMIERTLPTLARATSVGATTLGSDNVILGATAQVLQYELGVL
ncbi:MAG: ROK family transcriptional regulator [Anaerolineales bacterium]|nr:ROK family transcriptional regulator [Anaerolineales bacterium]